MSGWTIPTIELSVNIMDINVALSPHFDRFVRDQIKTGRYNNVSEVIHVGLQLLEDAIH